MKDLQIIDKKGNDLFEDDIIYDGKNYYRCCYNDYVGELFLTSCELGIFSEISEVMEITERSEKIGIYKENKHLFQCD